jgi:hypothetical protein
VKHGEIVRYEDGLKILAIEVMAAGIVDFNGSYDEYLNKRAIAA